MGKLFGLVVCFFMFQSSANALQVYNNTKDSLYYVAQVRQKGTSKVLCELDLSKDGISSGKTQKLKFKNREVTEFLEKQEKILEREEKRRVMKPLEGEDNSPKEGVFEGEGIPSGVNQKPKLKNRKGIKFFKRGEKRRTMTPLEEAVVSSENASKSSSTSLPGIAVEEEGALEVIIRIGLGNDMTLCTLENLNHLIFLHDFARADFCKDENNTYTLKLTDLRDTSSLVITKGEKIADESRG